jgi:phage-related protein
MMKGIKFNDVHSYDDLNLVLSEVNIPPATAKTNYVDIPGGDGSVDLTEALGEVKYQDRGCKFTFTVFPSDNFEEKKMQVSNLLNGRRFKITVDKDPDYYWTGRCSIDEYSSDKNLHKIVVGAVVAPYKLKQNQTEVIVPAGTKVNRTLQNGRKTVAPIITCTAEATIIFNGNAFTFNAGVHRNLGITLVEGGNTVTVTSTGTVTFTYQEGDL